MALNEYGKEARRIRLERELLLKDVADLVGVSPAFLSALEAGRKPIPPGFVAKVARALELTRAEAERLEEAAAKSAREFRLSVGAGTPAGARDTALMLARTFDSLTEEDFAAIRAVIERRRA